MSQAYLDRSRQNDSNSSNNTPSQQKEDFEAQMKKLDMNINNPGWNIADISPAQMFAEEEEEKQAKANEEELQMKPGEEEELQKKEDSKNPGTKTSMPNDLQSRMENSFGVDFSDVDIHKDSEQAPSLSSLAYTQGNDIHFAPGQYDPGSQKGQELLGHELSHVVQQRDGRVRPTKQGKGMPVNDNPSLEKEADEMGAKAAQGKMADVTGKGSGVQRQEDENAIAEPDPVDQIFKAVVSYRNGYSTMPELARTVLPYVEEHSLRINAIFSILESAEKDNFAYALAANSPDLMIFDDMLLKTMSEALNTYYTFSRDDNLKEKRRVDDALTFKATPAGKLEILFKKDSLTQDEVTEAKGLIDKFPFAIVRNAYYKRLLPLEAASDLAVSKDTFNTTGDYEPIYGTSPNALNSSLTTWARGESYNSTTDLTSYTINDNNFIDKDTYDSYVDAIAVEKGIEANSADGKAIAFAARAAREDAYFDEITKHVTAKLNLFNESVESNQVNPILKHRLGRFHRYLSAVGLFTGNMTGGACRSAAKAHRWAIPHVMVHGERTGSRPELRNNLINVYNGETVEGGSKDSSNNIKDTDGNIWATPEHFSLDEEENATSLKDSDWIDHIKDVGNRDDWSPLIAEGYKRGDPKRFPLGLQSSPGRSNHITGDAIDINKNGFTNMNDARIDIIAFYFGLSRPVSVEQWHFESINMALSNSEKEEINNSTRNLVIS